jgi:hypothetical protein
MNSNQCEYSQGSTEQLEYSEITRSTLATPPMANWRKNVLFEKSPAKGEAIPHALVLLVVRIYRRRQLCLSKLGR